MAKFREISWSNSKKTPWQMSGGKDRQNMFHRILPATARGQISTTPVDWHLKVKDKKCVVCLIKNYCIIVNMQKISSIHKLIQQILGSHELNDHAHFWPGHPKIIEITFSFLELCDHPVTRLATPISDHTLQKKFWSTLIYVNLFQHAKNQALIYSGDMVD